MGAKHSKNENIARSLSAISESKNKKATKKRNLRAVLSSRKNNSNKAPKNHHPTPLACTTRHELPKQEHHHDQQTKQTPFEDTSIPNIATFAPEETSTLVSSSSKRPASSKPVTPTLYDPASAKQRKSKRILTTSAVAKHMSMSSNSDLGYSNKSGLSSGWTTLSCDPFSQIEANTSAFTEITDQSTITLSRKSLHYSEQVANYSPFSTTLPSYQASSSAQEGSSTCIMDYMLTAEKILDELIHSSGPSEYHRIIKDAFIKVQEQNDPEDWQQFFIAISQFASSTQDAVANVYLARCFISGLGVTTNIEHGFGLLKSQESCETSYALGHCYFNGLPPPSPSYTNGHTIQEVDRVAAFEYFRKAASYDPSISTQETVATIAEAQCIMARMLFQGDGVTQNSKEALHYLMLSAENNNMYAQFLIGVHYERGFDIAQDFEKAKYYYGKSADQGFADAQAALGIKLIAEAQYAQGIEWLQKAVEKGNSRAHVLLGILHEKGEGVVQNDEMALFHYKAAVESNNSAAQYIFGLVLYFGRLGRQKNYKDGIRLIKQSAYAGFPYAQRVLGQLYQQGSLSVVDSSPADTRYRTKRNEKEAIRWYKRATTGKDVLAMGILGNCHENGNGVDVDYEKALSYYAKAAEQDSPYVFHAQLSQALLLQKMARHAEAFRLYSNIAQHANKEEDTHPLQTSRMSIARYHLCPDIEDVPYNPVLSLNILTVLAETTNNPHAHYWLGACYDEGIPDVCAVDRQKAFYHFRIAAEAGDNDATFLIAYMMSNNVIPDKGPADAFPWYQKAALKGHRTSMYSLGLCYYKGIGIDEPNMDIALEWFEKAARMGVADSMSYIGRIYLQKYMSGQTDESMQYFKTALVWLKKAADKNDTYSQRELGKMHLGGKVVEINYDLAVTLLERASQKNDPEAIFYLGECYYKGTGVVKDNETAITHYMRAASLGYPLAYTAVAELYYEVGNMNLAYDHFLLASKVPKIENTKIGKNAKLMAARIALGYYTVPVIQNSVDPSAFIRPTVAFDILSSLSIQDQFAHAFQPLAFCYLNGNGTAANIMQASFWFRKAADELNDSISLFHLAEIYGSGVEMHTDIELALAYLKKSADLGYSEAQFRMGIIYLQGEYGLPIDERTSMHWLRLAAGNSHAESMWTLSKLSGRIDQPELELQYQKSAAALGHLVAMRTLGQKYLHLVNAPFTDVLLIKDYLEEGLKYLHLAADRGDVESLVILGHTYANCTKTKVRFSNPAATKNHLPTPSDDYTHNGFCASDLEDEDEEVDSKWQSEEDEKKLAIECFEQASALGDLNATVLAAEAWHEQKQYTAALEYFEKAASQGSVIARFFCARYCIEGHPGCPADPEKGFQELLICAQELNCVHAYNTLGQCYESGVGVSKNDQLAFEWYYRAAEATQDAEAYYRMGCMYSEERVPLPDLSMNKDMEAYKLYNLAVEASPESHGLACYELAMYNMNGITGNHQQVLMIADVCLAIEYLRTSADLNVTKSMLELALLFLNDDFPIEEQEEGFRRLAHAAELDLMEAQYELGRFYHLGKEVILVGDDTNEADDEDIDGGDEEECVVIPQNFEKAYDLFCRSAAQKHPTATYYLGLYHQHGIFVAPDLSIALEQYEIAVQLFEQCGDAPERWQAEFNLACILHHDVESRHRAYDLFQVAQLHAPEESKFLSKIMITRYHLYGWGDVSIQAEEAVSTLIQFSHDEKTGYYVFLDIAHCYETGTGVPQDLRQAFYWYGEVVGKAHLVGDNDNILDEEVEENEANAMFKLAEFYRNGWVVSKDLEKAEDLYKLAANKGSQAAQEYLSIMLQRTNIYD